MVVSIISSKQADTHAVKEILNKNMQSTYFYKVINFIKHYSSCPNPILLQKNKQNNVSLILETQTHNIATTIQYAYKFHDNDDKPAIADINYYNLYFNTFLFS
jgi:hypothetical protein